MNPVGWVHPCSPVHVRDLPSPESTSSDSTHVPSVRSIWPACSWVMLQLTEAPSRSGYRRPLLRGDEG